MNGSSLYFWEIIIDKLRNGTFLVIKRMNTVIERGVDERLTESNDWLIEELKKVEKWEKDQSDLWFWEKLGRLPFKLIDKLTPAFIQKKIGVILDELGQYVQNGGSYLSSVSSLSSYYPDLADHTLEKRSKSSHFLPWIKL